MPENRAIPVPGSLVRAQVHSSAHGITQGDIFEVLVYDEPTRRILIRNQNCVANSSACILRREEHGCGWWSLPNMTPAVYGPRCAHITYPYCICGEYYHAGTVSL